MSAAVPTVSVIVPSHNHGAFLDATLRSVYAQSWPELDVIVVDDGSTDDTVARLVRWRERGVRVEHQPQGGASAARNRGVALARGDYIAFLDADDLWPRADMIEAALACMAAMPDIAWTFGDAQPFEDRAGEKSFLDRPYCRPVAAISRCRRRASAPADRGRPLQQRPLLHPHRHAGDSQALSR